MNHHANAFKIRIWQWGLLAAIFVFWWAMTKPGLIPPFFFSNDSQAAFFFGEPYEIFMRIKDWFVGGEIYRHLAVTRYETPRRGPIARTAWPPRDPLPCVAFTTFAVV